MSQISDWPRAVAHIDADHFFANCELIRRPQLRGKPMMVLGKLGSCILAKTPEAKALGIKTAMPLWEAKKLCPKGIYIQGDFRHYTLISRQLMSILNEWSPVLEVYSVDEAFMDLDGLRGMYRMPYDRIADRIREEVEIRLGITVSVGISVNKTLAKIACEINKPNGTTIVPGRGIDDFLSTVPVADIPGIGRSRQALLEKFGIKTALQLTRTSRQLIQHWFGKTGLLLWRELKGEKSFPIQKDPPPPKSIGRTSSFNVLTGDLRPVRALAIFHLERAIESLVRHNLLAGELTLYLRAKSFQTYGLTHRFENPTCDFFELVRAVSAPFENASQNSQTVPRGIIWRSAGVYLNRLSPASSQQLSLFEDPQKRLASEKLNQAKLDLNERFGRTTVCSATTLFINLPAGRQDSKCRKKGRANLPFL